MTGKSKLTFTAIVIAAVVGIAVVLVITLTGSTERLLNQAQETFEEGNYQEALTIYKRVLYRDESNARALLATSRLCRLLGRFEDSLTYADEYLALKPRSIEGLVNKGEALMASDSYDEASQNFSDALDLEPSNPDALAGLGSCQLERGRTTPLDQYLLPGPQEEAKHQLLLEARSNLERALQSGANSYETRRKLIECLLELHDVDDAYPLAESLRREEPRGAINLYLLGLCQLASGSVEEAWGTMQQAFDIARSDEGVGKSHRLAIVQEGNGIVAYRRGMVQEAIDYFIKASRNDEDRTTTYLSAAALLELTGDREGARPLLIDAVRRLVPPETPETVENCQAPVPLYRLLNVTLRLGRQSKAVDYLKQLEALSPGFVQIIYEDACLQIAEGKEPQACRTLERALDIEPNHSNSNYDLGTLLLRRENPKQAIPYFRKVIEEDSAAVDARINLAEALRRVGNFSEADKQYEVAMRMAPKNPDVLTSFGHSLELQGKFDEALAKYQEVIKLSPRNPEARYRLGLFYLKRGEGEKAESVLGDAVDANPDDQRLRIALGDARFLAGLRSSGGGRLRDFRQAEEAYQQVREQSEGIFEAAACTGLGNVQLARGDTTKALDLFDQAVESSSERRLQAYTFVNRAHAALLADSGAEALQYGDEALRFAPDSAVAHYNMGCIYAARENWSGALRYFEKATELDEHYDSAALNLALANSESGKPDKAISLLDSNLEQGLNITASAIALGCLEAQSGDTDKARKAFDKALTESPGSPSAQANLSLLLASTNKEEDALSLAAKIAESQDGDDATRGLAQQVAGVLYARRGQWQDAQKSLMAALELTSRSRTDTLMNLGIVYRSQGLFTNAEKSFQEALIERPRETRILNALGDLYCHTGDYEKAKEFFGRSLAQERDQPRIREAANRIDGILKPL